VGSKPPGAPPSLDSAAITGAPPGDAGERIVRQHAGRARASAR
jgi:hypothetical protein